MREQDGVLNWLRQLVEINLLQYHETHKHPQYCGTEWVHELDFALSRIALLMT